MMLGVECKIGDVTYGELAEFFIAAHATGALKGVDDCAQYAEKTYSNAIIISSRVGGRLVGVCAFYCNRPEKDFGFVTQIYVVREFRRKGFGDRLMGMCIAEVRRLGFARLDLMVDKDNIIAQHFYERWGFEHIGETDGQYKMSLRSGND